MNYILRNYQKGDEAEQARIGIEVAQKWIWPYAYDKEDLLAMHAQPDFDPETRVYCFLGDEMVGYMYSLVKPMGDDGVTSAYLDFPRMVPGNEPAAELLIEKTLQTLHHKGVSRLYGHVNTMVPGDIRLAEKMGFTIKDWGFKVYYTYAMEWGPLPYPAEEAEEIHPDQDLEKCAEIAMRWYGRPADWCFKLLRDWHEHGIITHLGLWENGILSAACMAAPNVIRPATAAIYYIYTPDEARLKPMLVQVINRCIQCGAQNVIADLVNDHRQFEPTYQELGFKKVAEWARWECTIDEKMSKLP
jgi:hypothetical protein